MINLAIRGYVEGHLQFEELVTLPDDAAVERMIPVLATQHATALADHKLHMIEIEFLDEPNPLEGFLLASVIQTAIEGWFEDRPNEVKLPQRYFGPEG